MSCFNSNCYLPQPPRAWSRVQNSCSVITDTDNTALVIDPYTKQLIPRIILAERIAMLNKGNVLQYKANSSNLTKSQKYSKIAKGQWVNRNTTWATQSTRGYTNPNTTSLKRSGNVVNIAIDPITGAIIGPTTEPISCPKPLNTINEGLPSNSGGGSDVKDPDIPPPVEPEPSSETFPSIIPDTIVEPIVIQDEGVLICSVQENVCTGETKSNISQQLCHPTTDSDVPGTIQELCWNDGTQTWYPRQRYIMTNSTDKWPTNAVLFSSVKPLPPIITSITSNINIVTLTWIQSEKCLPVLLFNIFQNGILIQVVPGSIFTTDIIVNNCNTYNYFIIGVTNGSNITSDPSNIVSINVSYIDPPINLISSIPASQTIYLDWESSINYCGNAIYKIYQDTTFIGNTPDTNFTVSLLVNCDTYTFSVVTSDSYGNVSIPVYTTLQLLWPNPPTNLNYITTSSGSINLTWLQPNPNCATAVSYKIYYDSNIYNTSNLYYTFNNLINCSSYTFSVSALDIYNNESTLNTIIAIPLWPNPPTNLNYITTSSGSIKLTWLQPNPNCATAVSYNVYYGANIYNTSNLYYTFNNLINCSSYTFSVSALDIYNNESTLNTIIAIPLWPNPPTNLSASMSDSISIIYITWSLPVPNCSPPTSYTLYWSLDNIIFNSIPNISSNLTLYEFTGANFNTTYYFYMASVNSIGTSGPTPIINITTPFIYSISGDTNYTEEIVGNNYTLTFNANSSSNGNYVLTFYVNIDEIRFTLIGGGGGGRGSGYYPESDPSLELLVGGVGGGGASSVICLGFSVASLGAPDSLSLVVGKGGKGGLNTTGPPEASPGNTTSVSPISGTSFYATAPGGKTSTSIGVDSTQSPLGNIYYAIGAPQADQPTFWGAYISETIGGGSRNGSGIIYDSTPGQSNAHIEGGNGYNAHNPSGNLPYGGGGGTNIMNDLTGDTFSGSVVSLNDIGGLQGTSIDDAYDATYLPGNQSSGGYGTTQTPGFGSGGGGGGLYWRFNGSDFFGVGGDGGDGLMIITFTYIP